MWLKKYTPRMSYALGFTAAVSMTSLAHANGGHFLVDEATITPIGECALDTWIAHSDSTSVLTLMPMCAVQSGWELALPAELNLSDGKFDLIGFEAKRMLSESFLDGALALSMGTAYNNTDDSLDVVFVNIPYTRTIAGFGDLHINLGAEYAYSDRQIDPTWGVASTHAISDSQDLILEVAGLGQDRPTAALGLRSATRGGWEVDVSFARDFETRANIATLGVNVAF
ncbi:MAG: hypothetical protein JJU10_00560 [Idiomarina sp.]|nr:hypothetical protein [Idiomarina sp.]